MKKIVFLILGLSIFSICDAQILNIENFRLEKDTSHVFLGNVGFGFNAKKQATNTVNRYNSNINAGYLSHKNAYLLISTLALVKVSNQQVQNEGYIHFRINFDRTQQFSSETFTQLQYDRGRGLNKRFLVGYTIRSKIFNNKKWSISGNSGIMYENENWNFAAETKTTHVIKSTTNLTIKSKINQNLNWYFITYYQALFGIFFKPRLTTDTYLQFKINNNFNFNLQYVSTYDKDPLVPIPNLIYSFNSVFQYNF